MDVRLAGRADAGAMCHLVNAIIERGGTTAFGTAFGEDALVRQFIAAPLGISCMVALEQGRVIGFQALEWPDPDWPGEDPLPDGWALISSFVAIGRQRRGVGRGLFSVTLDAARRAAVRHIDATIRRANTGGLAFYDRLGFVDHRWRPEYLCKRFDVPTGS